MCVRKAGVTKIGDSARARRQDFSGQTAEKGRVAGPQTLSQARGPGGRHPGRYVPALSALADGSRFCLFNPQLSSPYVGVRGFLARGYFILGRDGGGGLVARKSSVSSSRSSRDWARARPDHRFVCLSYVAHAGPLFPVIL